MRYLLLILTFYVLPAAAKPAQAIFAGGCFWCMEADFDKVPGVLQTNSGYDGGTEPNPSYELVSSGTTPYVESVQVIYDPAKVSYQQLLDYYWHHIDPTQINAQFCDKGRQYRSVIFYLNEEQKKTATASKRALENVLPAVHTDIIPSTHFYAAEEYHQDYYQKNPIRYKYYRYRCGRDQRVEELWHVKTD
ncbi:MsrA3 - peptide methionine sulfoxide reductase [Legionella geestiana]|uniref:Peptide methionine sulfoxide reductase MsrA n=2 Tax=Legionella geestiana TaxID=45065 RepID=A0A0W0TJQ2_9GAMM|nr:peptide-methionine (S)-S-oxide reductase MsrA [Legionella geestiana]KTC95863.1 MsrA3 - peptide methionine sulfoxide reductase [Legionella geestiana]QBS13275.1 peptide-methionine (S)-S-oxide reductase [Legionella geestiana]QDQ40865.1 peptide-methionine (S)-S-oxide reductase MsrA [Legionella geestiana]STX54199.1 MsrA3 - peptide methionine sulfoxide reductase [Legionella geestiana]